MPKVNWRPDDKSPSHSFNETRVPAVLSAMLTFEESSPFLGGGLLDPPRLFFNKSLVRSFSSFEKPLHRPRSFSSVPALYFNKSQVCSFSSVEILINCALPGYTPMRSTRTPNKEAPQFGCGHASLASSHRHGCSAFADWPRPIPACGI